MVVLKLNSKGEEVKKLQEKLGLKADGVFGLKTEKAVKDWQRDHGLIPDGIVGTATWNSIFQQSEPEIDKPEGFVIKEMFLPTNKGMHMGIRGNHQIKYLVIHYTAGGSSKEGSAASNRNVFLTRNASADFCIDDKTIVQCNPDPLKYYCWAVGDGKGKYGINNYDCISIEMCSNLKKGTTAKVPNHEGWYLTDEVINNTIKLAKYLIDKYNIPINNVIRHYDATHKLCPGIIGWNPGPIYDSKTAEKTKVFSNEDEWYNFKKQLVS